ncbi:hypothetical protein ACA910_006240 [Epithemia clementina (nom. ined.)]
MKALNLYQMRRICLCFPVFSVLYAFCLGMATTWLLQRQFQLGIVQPPKKHPRDATLLHHQPHHPSLHYFYDARQETTIRGRNGTNHATTSTTTEDKDNERLIYAHVHMAKTAGSTINGYLAAQYERVCGNKGYSYDFYQYNQRVHDQIHSNETGSGLDLQVEKLGDTNDTIRRAFGDIWNRGRVPQKVVDEIGYENCDYISLELPWQEWSKRFDASDNIELHVPCRDPLVHLLSNCNHRHINFNCQAPDLIKVITKCFKYMDRFDVNLSQILRNDSTTNSATYGHSRFKCFDAIPVEPYLDYMGQRLQRKRKPAQYAHRSTNLKRNQQRECLLQPNNKALAEQVEQLLLKHYDYFAWCQDCLQDPRRNLLYEDYQQKQTQKEIKAT